MKCDVPFQKKRYKNSVVYDKWRPHAIFDFKYIAYVTGNYWYIKHTYSRILKVSDLVKLPICLLNYGWIGSDPRGREVEILDIFVTCEKVTGAVQSA